MSQNKEGATISVIEEEFQEEQSNNNRLFIIIAVALVGLICIGLMGLGGVLLITRNTRAEEEQARAATLQPPTPIPPTNTPTSTITPTPTNTPEPTPTSTQVVSNQGQPAQEEIPPQPEEPTETPEQTPEDSEEAIAQADEGEGQAEHDADLPAVTPTNTLVVEAPAATEALAAEATPGPPEVPVSGGILSQANNAFLFWAAGGVLLILLMYGAFSRSKPF
jgi:hypothetical protein